MKTLSLGVFVSIKVTFRADIPIVINRFIKIDSLEGLRLNLCYFRSVDFATHKCSFKDTLREFFDTLASQL